MNPYASVIIPTHDRSATLRYAVTSVQAQTVREIEILLVCDGATQEVLEICRGIQSSDPRVRVLEFAKGAGAGGSNRDLAIREHARAERIFYTDDDDLWLASHVERIGPCLNSVDVVDTLPVSATLCGRLALAPVNSGNPLTRALLVEDRMKMMYDTHLAHRRSTYLRLGSPWTLSVGGDVVRRLFATFAGDSGVSWETLPIATAVSLHGGARSAASPADRKSEIERWGRDLRAATPDDVVSRASLVWQLFSCLAIFPSEPADDLRAYLARLGLNLPGDTVEAALELPIGSESRQACETAFALHRREITDPKRIATVASLLLDIVKNAIASWGFLRRALSRLSFAQASDLLAQLQPCTAQEAELLAIFNVYHHLWARKVDEAWTLAGSILRKVNYFPQEIELVAGDVLLELGRHAEGLELVQQAAARAHRGSAIQLRLAQACLRTGNLDEGFAALEEAETRIGGMKQTMELRRRLEDATSLVDGSISPP